jgi:hypothetical protein
MTEQDRAHLPAQESKYRVIDRKQTPPKIIYLQTADLARFYPDMKLERRDAEGNWKSSTESAPEEDQPEQA